MKKLGFYSLLVFFVLAPHFVSAQEILYTPQNRPAGLDWQQIKTEHFRIIFPNGYDSLARRSAAILESQYQSASELTGGKLKNFPVILKPYNDLANGFVSSFNFRSEFDISPIKGKAMNPKTGDWLETVLPHELVHATHFNVQQDKKEQKLSFPNLISYLSPDLARSFHGFVPVGLHEGLAVYYESEEIAPHGGRGHYTFSTNRFNANFGGLNRWNMGQTLIPSDYTLPNNRHYIAGYSFIDWLHDTYGDSVSKDAIRFHYHHFIFGYGYALRRVTGKWPGQLYALYERDLEENEAQRLSEIPVNTTERSRILETPFKGEQAHGPKWISESQLIFYGSFYNARLGFYKYDLETGNVSLLKESFSVGDYNYELDADSNFYYSSYSRDPLYAGIYYTDIHTLNIDTGKDISLTKKARVFAPTTGAGRIIGIRALSASGRIVEVLDDGSVITLKNFNDASPISVKVNPADSNQIAVIINRRGTQALWITDFDSMQEDLEGDPILAFREGSIHDPEWHPDGDKILFTMDASPAMNIFEYELETGNITQLTGSLYNAFEASYSPDGESIAYILQIEDEQKLAILDRKDFLGEPVSNDLLLFEDDLQEEFSRPLLGSDLENNESWVKEAYKADLGWLKPRLIYPVIRENAGATQYGAGIMSIDALSGQSYLAEVSGIQNRLWYNLSYTNKTFYPGFELSTYSEPVFFAVTDPTTDQQFPLMRQDRGISLSIPFNYTLRSDTRLSSFHFNPEISAEQFKFFDLSPTELSDFATRYKAGVFSQLNIGILNLPRDVQPSAGFSVFGLIERSLNEPSVEIDFEEGIGQSVFGRQWAAYYGAFTYLSPLRRFNQSLRLDFRFLHQSSSPIYSNSTIIPMGFGKNPFPNSIDETVYNNIGRFSTRYTIPLLYPDKGGLTVPLYLSSVYLTGFSHTLTNLADLNSDDLLASSRSIFGASINFQFKLSNVLLDFGFGLAYEPTRNKTEFIFGQF